MSDKPEILDGWDFPDSVRVADGCERKLVPEATKENIQFLMEQHNKLVEYVLEKLDE